MATLIKSLYFHYFYEIQNVILMKSFVPTEFLIGFMK